MCLVEAHKGRLHFSKASGSGIYMFVDRCLGIFGSPLDAKLCSEQYQGEQGRFGSGGGGRGVEKRGREGGEG